MPTFDRAAMGAPPVHAQPAGDSTPGDELGRLVHSITAVEALVAAWDERHVATVQALKASIEALHKEALTRLIRALKGDPAAGPRLRAALADPVVYGVLRFHGLVKVPLAERLQAALEEVTPALAAHGGGVELVALKAPDTVELRLLGSCHGCPSSAQTLSAGVEAAIRRHCPEILHIHQVSRGAVQSPADGGAALHFVSPFALRSQAGWIDAGTLSELPEGGVAARTLLGRSVLLARLGMEARCFDNACAHLGMPLDAADVENGVITCGYHGFRYSLDSGECLSAPAVQLNMHAVRVSGDRVQVRLEN
jgi:Fe-S cluster biogenesis protein NfuA/nitrite reductase/ring-hydroxylating ferredoxin subunit